MTSKRNWALVSDFLENNNKDIKKQKLEATKEEQALLNYNNIQTNQQVKQSNIFIQNNFGSSNQENLDYSIKNNINNRTYKGSYTTQLTVRDFKTNFENLGHVLCYDISSSYITPIMLDLDCIQCKRGCCNHPIDVEVINTILIESIAESISSLLKIQLDVVLKNIIILKKHNQCNLHVHVNYSASIILLNILRNAIATNLPSDIQDRYLIDDVTTLDFPYSSKNGSDVYKPVDDNDAKLDIIVTPTLPFFELPLATVSQFNYTTSMKLGSFSITNTNNDWYDENINTVYLTTPIILDEVYTTNTIHSYIKNIKISHLNFTTTIKILDLYFNVVDDNKLISNFLDVAVFEKLGNSDLQLKVKETILSLSVKIAKVLYKETNISAHQKLVYLLNFIIIDDCGYAFYIIMSIISFVIYTNNSHKNVDINIYKATVLDIIQNMAEFVNQTNLLRIIKTIQNFNIYVKLETLFKDPTKWFIEIIKQIEYNKYSSTISFLSSQITVMDSLKILEKELIKFCKLEIPLIRMGSESGTYFYYSDGLYNEIKETLLLSQTNNLKTKSVQINMAKFVRQMKDEQRISAELYEQCNEKFYKDVWFLYLLTVPVKKVHFNLYDYFIATKFGVFNTITGLYMHNTPLLYMNAQKSYCTIPQRLTLENLKLNDLNKYIANEYKSSTVELQTIIEKQTTIFYIAVMVPGLLTLQDSMFSNQNEMEIIKKVSKTILEDDSVENYKQIYYILPVILHYKLSIPKLKYLLQHIEYLNRFSVDGLVSVCNLHPEIKYTETEYDYEKHTANNEAFLADLETDSQFNAKGFIFIVLLAVIDQCRDEELDNLFDSPMKESKIKIPQIYTRCDLNNFMLQPFEHAQYSSETNINFRRALNMILPSSDFTESYINLLNSLSHTFNFDSTVLDDFLYFSAMIYYPGSERKRILLMIGSQSCGKTTIQDAFYRMQPRATFSIDSVVQGNSGPAPELIKVYNSYLFNIVELKNISPEIMKTLTGGDLQFKRQLYQNEYKEMRPLAFTIAATNSIPTIPGADEAIKVRLAPFMLNSLYDTLVNHEDNTLILNIKNILIKSPTFNISDFAMELSNLLYTQFLIKRDAYSLITPKISENNKPSQKLVTECLTKNNYIYNILDQSKIVFNPTLSITVDDLKIATEYALEEFNQSTQKKKLGFNFIKRSMDIIFMNYINVNKDGYNGFGLDVVSQESINIIDLIPDVNSKCKIVKIKSYLLSNNFQVNNINNKITALIKEYSSAYNSETQSFIGYKMYKKKL